MAKRTSKRPARPRVPLPRQTGGAHPDRTKVVPRKRKHKKAGGTDEQD